MSETTEDDEPQLPTSHTVVSTGADGQQHVQHFGVSHVVSGSVRFIELRPGESVVIRHLR